MKLIKGYSMKRRKKKISEFTSFLENLPEDEVTTVNHFFQNFSKHCALNKKGTELLRKDFENALLHYHSVGTPLEKALELLSIENLGGFYIRPPILWYTLDDAAKIYPLSMKPGQMEMFRLSVYLKDNVIPELLQMALNFTIKRFPSFATTVKKGFFWHYLDTAKRRYNVKPETGPPCKPLNISRSASQTFRVIWYQNRISVEFFHILTDGSGGMQFLKALTAEYLRLCGVISDEEGIMKRNDLPTAEEIANEFFRTETTEKGNGFMDMPATQMSGKLSKIKPCQVLHFRMDATSLKKAANEHEATITAYVLSKIFLATKAATDELDGTINIQVPVNMRKYYPSQTVRNFSLYCGIRFPMTEITDSPELIRQITEQLKIKGSREAMGEMMNSTRKIVSMLRFIPLVIKSPVAKAIYGFLSDGIFSTRLSNMGVVTMPQEYADHIQSMDFLLGPAVLNRATCTIITFGNTATLSITKMTNDPSFEEALFRFFCEDGIMPEVEGSSLYGN